MSTRSQCAQWPSGVDLIRGRLLGCLLHGLLACFVLGGREVGEAAPPAPPSPSPSRTDDARTARALALLDAARAATGGAQWARVHAIRYRAAVSSGARQGTAETVEDTRTGRFVDRYVLGEVGGGQGFDGTAAWTSDVSGRGVSSGAAEGAASNVNEVYRRSLAYWFRARHPARFGDLGPEVRDGRSFERIAIEPAGGRPFEMWIDLQSHRIARLLDNDSGVARVTEFSDYRPVQGLSLPFAVRTSVGEPRFDTLVRFTSIEIDPVLPADAFARPPSGP
jgi:hypothetical protein